MKFFWAHTWRNFSNFVKLIFAEFSNFVKFIFAELFFVPSSGVLLGMFWGALGYVLGCFEVCFLGPTLEEIFRILSNLILQNIFFS